MYIFTLALFIQSNLDFGKADLLVVQGPIVFALGVRVVWILFSLAYDISFLSLSLW